MMIKVKKLESGYFHIRGEGFHDFAQPSFWPCDRITLVEHAAPEARGEFIDSAMNIAAMEIKDDNTDD